MKFGFNAPTAWLVVGIVLASIAAIPQCFNDATTPGILRGPSPYRPCVDGGPVCYGQCVEHLSGGMACEAIEWQGPGDPNTLAARQRDAGAADATVDASSGEWGW